MQGSNVILFGAICVAFSQTEGAERVTTTTSPAGAVRAWSPAGVTELMQRVKAYQLRHPVMSAADRDWERGTWYTGVMAAWKATRDERYLQQALDWGRLHDWQVGREEAGGNKLTCTQTWIELYLERRDPAMIQPVIRWLDSGASNTPTGAEVWYRELGLRYSDSLYVGPPALAMLAKATGRRQYLDWMDAYFRDVHAELFDAEAGLFYRDKRFRDQRTAGGRKIFWSRGNGWAMGGVVRVLEYLPTDDPRRGWYLELLRTMARAVVRVQGEDGLWRANLADPEEYPAPESSGTGFFCYALAWGINHGVLDRDRHLPAVRRAWDGLARCVTPEGRLQWGQPVGDRPVAVERDSAREYVTGTFLLAGSEVLRLARLADGERN